MALADLDEDGIQDVVAEYAAIPIQQLKFSFARSDARQESVLLFRYLERQL